MGTTASAGSQPALVAPTHQAGHRGNSMAEDRSSLSSSLQALNIPNSKAKSIITNKVAPVVITYNCREEFQIHDSVLSANYTVGRISDTMPEHYLVLGEFFMVQDVNSRADVLNTTGSYGAPNFRKAKGNYPLYGMGQPSLNGFKQVLQRLETEAYEEVIFLCVREEPIVFLRLDKDFVPYTPRRKENLHENLLHLKGGVRAEQLELSIRKELCDFAKLNENIFYVYNNIEHFKDEPQHVRIVSEEDIHVTEEVYKRPLFTIITFYRYYRLPLPIEGAPLEEDFDAFVNILRESPGLSVLRDDSRPLPALLFSCQEGVGRTNLGLILGALILQHLQRAALYFYLLLLFYCCSFIVLQGSSTKGYFLQRTLQSIESYFYLIVFNAYLHDQVSSEYLAPDLLGTAKEMRVANFRRVLKTAVYGMAQPSSEAVSMVLSYLTDEKRKHSSILWINLQEEMVVEGNGQMFTPREPVCVEQPISVCVHNQESLEQMRMLKSCRTLQELFEQQQTIHPGLTYRRVPLHDCCAPNEEVFDQLLEAMKSTLAEDAGSAFIFNCSDGKDRTTTAMVISTLTLWHFNGFPECGDEEIVSVPDAKYTKGEFEVVMQVVRLLPNGYQMKREVDMALDIVSETMTPMHYHLREIIICSYKQIKSAKSDTESQQLRLKSLQYLERYIYLILFNSYLHLEKKDSWRRPFSLWMHQVAAKAGIYAILNQLGFPEFEAHKDSPLASLRHRWQKHGSHSLPIRGDFI
uniref:Phosphatase domain containing paladin 1b n=1 Tax=Astyanax mexicanus TaxID=7994 RepID=A0A8B9LBE9_ASTMX